MASAAEVRAGLAYIELTIRNKINAGLQQASKDFSRFIVQTQRAGFGLMLSGGFLSVPIISAIESAADLEKTLALVKEITGEATGEMDKLRQSVQRTAMAMPFTEVDIARGALNLARAGAGRNQIASSLPGLSQFAMMADTDLDTAATILSRTASAMKIDLADLDRVANVMAITANSTATNMEEFGTAMSYTAGPAKQLNLELEELATLLQLVTEGGGGAGSRAGAGLRNAMILTLAKADDLKADLGVDVIDTATGATRSFVDVIRQLVEARARLGNDDFQRRMIPIFQSRNFQIINAIVGGFDKYEDVLKRVSEDTEYLDNATKNMASNFGFLWERLKSNLDALRNSVGKAAGEGLTGSIKSIEGAVSMAIQWVQANQAVVASVARIAFAFVAVGSAIWLAGTLIQVFAFGVAPFITLLGLLGSLTIKFVALATMNPFGMAITGTLAFIAYLGNAEGVLANLSTTAIRSADRIGQAWANIGSEIQRAIELGNAQGVSIGVSGLVQQIKDEIGGAFNQGWDHFFGNFMNAIFGYNNLASDAEADFQPMFGELQKQIEAFMFGVRYEEGARANYLYAQQKLTEAQIRKSNEEAAVKNAADEVEREKKRVEEEREKLLAGLRESLAGVVTTGGFSGFTASFQPLFAQTKAIEEKQLEALKGIEDAIHDVALNTDKLRDLETATFVGDA